MEESGQTQIDPTLCKMILNSVQEGDLNKIQSNIEKYCIDIKALKDIQKDQNAFFSASLIKDDEKALEVFKYLKSKELSPNEKDKFEQTCLYYTCREGKNLCSKFLEEECNLSEKYYGTKYSKEKLNITEDEINSYNCKDIFDYPPENNFIPKNFDLLPPPEKIGKYPEKIIDHKNMEVWYLQDTIFQKPKVFLTAQFITPEDLCNFSEIKLRIITSIFDKIIQVELGEFLYMAEEANVNITFSTGVNKSQLIFSGFNDSLKKGIRDIFTKIQNLDMNTERCKETLELEQKNILRKTKNSFFGLKDISNSIKKEEKLFILLILILKLINGIIFIMIL